MSRQVVSKLVVVLIAAVLQLGLWQPSMAAGPNHVTLTGSHGPTPIGSASLCSMPNGSRIGLLDAIEANGPNYLHDFEFVPGVGTLSDGKNYTDNFPPNHFFGGWGYDIKGGYTVPANTPITVYTLAYTDATFSKPFYIAQMVFNCTTGKVISVYNGPFPIPGTKSSFICPMFFDGRLNDCDPGETVAIYCLPNGSVNILAIYKSKGYDAILATPAEIKAVPKHPTQNAAIKSGNGAVLYRLTSGELQVNRPEDVTGKMYHFIFQDCPEP